MKNEPVYIVTSFHRSGSSMMMRCLEAGGIPCTYETMEDIPANSHWTGWGHDEKYVPNPNGFYYRKDYDNDHPSFYEDNKGKAIKIARLNLPILPKGKYKIIYMVRPQEEILASMRTYIPHRSWGMPEVVTHLYDLIRTETIKMLLKTRDDFEIMEVHYHDVLNKPEETFQKIKDFGIPIDIKKAASMVDLSLYRHRVAQK